MGSHDVDPDLLPKGSSALHCAAMSDDVDAIAEIILQGQIFVDALDHWGRTPLHAALENGRYKAAMCLIQNRANLNLKNPEGESAYDVIHGGSCLQLLEDLVDQQIHIDINPQELVSVAIDNNNVDLLERVLAYPAVNVNYQDNMGRTALHSAVELKNMACVKLLLARAANTELKDWRDSSVLHCAAKIGDLEIFRLLLDESVEISEALNTQDHSGHNVLHLSFLHKRYHLVTFIAKEFSHFVKYTLADALGISVEEMLFKARDHIGPDVIPCLSTDEAQILLHKAVYRGDASVLPLLVDQGANLNCFDLMQQTPLIAATRLGHLECVQELLNLGALLNVTDFSSNAPLHYAARLGRTEITLVMLRTPGVRVTILNSAQETPLQLALLNHHAKTASALLDHLDQRSDENWICCMECCASWADRELLDKMKIQLLPHNWLQVLLGDDEYHFSGDSSETLETPRSTLIFDVSCRNKSYYIPLTRCCIVCPWCGKYIKNKRTHKVQDIENHCYTCSQLTNSDFYKEWFAQYRSTVSEVEAREQHARYVEHKKVNPRAISTAYRKLNQFTRKEVHKMSVTPTPPQIKTVKKTKQFRNLKKKLSAVSFYPVHVAACAGNVDFLDMVFSSIHSLSQKKALLVIKDETERSLLTLLASIVASPPISNMLVQHNLLELVSQKPVAHLTPTEQLLSVIDTNSITADDWDVFLRALDDSTVRNSDEVNLVIFLQKFRKLQQDSDISAYFDPAVVDKLCKKGLFMALLELIRLWTSYASSHACDHRVLTIAAKSVVFHCLECSDVPTRHFSIMMDELVAMVGTEHAVTLVEHHRYFFRSSRQNMSTVLILILKLFGLGALNWKLIHKIKSSTEHILLPYCYKVYKFSCDAESDPVIPIVNNRLLCYELFSSIKYCHKTSNLLLGACAVGSIQLVKLLLPIAPTSYYIKISKSSHFFITLTAVESHDTELLDTILKTLPTSDDGVLLSCTLTHCCRWLGMDLDDSTKLSQRSLHKQRYIRTLGSTKC